MKQCVSLFIFVFLAACQPAPTSPAATLPPPSVVIETITPSPVPTLPLTPSSTPTVNELIFPYTIDGLRQHEYQSGDIHIRFTLDENDFYTSYLIDYPSDGLMITGVMLIPKGNGPFPVIILNHGFFARSVYNSGDGTDRASAFLARRGYITLASDYRSWGGSDVGDSFFYSGLVIDVINLLNAIPSIPQADAKRVGMWGHSMGGGVTMKALTVDSHVGAAVLYSTVSADDTDILQRWGLGCIGDIGAGELQLGCNSADIVPLDLPPGLVQAYYDASTNSDLLHQTSPFYNLELVNTPIQIAYGTEDGKVFSGTPPEWSQKLYQGLKDAGKDVQLFAYEGERHSFIGDSWFAFMERTAKFFDGHVKNAK